MPSRPLPDLQNEVWGLQNEPPGLKNEPPRPQKLTKIRVSDALTEDKFLRLAAEAYASGRIHTHVSARHQEDLLPDSQEFTFKNTLSVYPCF